MKQHSATGRCILGLAVTVTFPRNLVGCTRDRKSAVFWNASKNIGILSLQMTLRALFFLYKVGRVCSVWRDLLCRLACVRRRNPFRFRSDYRNGEIKLHWGLLLFPDIRKAFYLIKNCVCLGEQSLHRECNHGRSLNRA